MKPLVYKEAHPCWDRPRTKPRDGWAESAEAQESLVQAVLKLAKANEVRYIVQLDELWLRWVLGTVNQKGVDRTAKIAFSRKMSALMAATFSRCQDVARKANEDIVLVGPSLDGDGTSAHLASWRPYFDIMGGQVRGFLSDSYHDAQRVAGLTQWYVDLCNRPIWMMVHLCETFTPIRDPESIREMYSQVKRAGGANVWLMNGENGGERAENLNPHKWEAMQRYGDLFASAGDLKRPKPDTGILFSFDSTAGNRIGGFRTPESNRVMVLYSLLGPWLGGAVRFVSDFQILHDFATLAGLKSLYIGFAPYIDKTVLSKIEWYLDGGGRVYSVDPEVFGISTEGKELTDDRKRLTTHPNWTMCDGDPFLPRHCGQDRPQGRTRNLVMTEAEPESRAALTVKAFQEKAGAALGDPTWEFQL